MTIAAKELLSKAQAKLSIQRAISYERRLGTLSDSELIAVLESAIGDLADRWNGMNFITKAGMAVLDALGKRLAP